MKEWSTRQLRSYLDAHGIEYQPPYPPSLKDRHYHKYLLKVLARHGRYRPDQVCKMNPAAVVEFKPKPLTLQLSCPVCMTNIRLDGGCRCTDGERFDGFTGV